MISVKKTLDREDVIEEFKSGTVHSFACDDNTACRPFDVPPVGFDPKPPLPKGFAVVDVLPKAAPLVEPNPEKKDMGIRHRFGSRDFECRHCRNRPSSLIATLKGRYCSPVLPVLLFPNPPKPPPEFC